MKRMYQVFTLFVFFASNSFIYAAWDPSKDALQAITHPMALNFDVAFKAYKKWVWKKIDKRGATKAYNIIQDHKKQIQKVVSKIMKKKIQDTINNNIAEEKNKVLSDAPGMKSKDLDIKVK